ncbi:TIGR04255 family protein [Sphingobium sp.]|uniref:TIGR04255 family protein n=1 Tax=Sphingobium sp. TaxID=1912891 RepID=UPI000DB5E9BA|nr:TIGR04255 family protein [Sphingobium sp.]PZU71070.1 MAG: hypothetical protein DI540_01045 [Sphingobium sp.]
MKPDESILLASAPINEVGFSFATESCLVDPFYVSELRGKFADEYPEIERHYPVAALDFTPLGSNPSLIGENDRGVAPRYWFVSTDGTRLVQTQERMASWNWRRRDGFEGKNPYIGYDQCKAQALAAFDVIEQNARRDGGHPPVISGAELMYDNIVLVPQGTPDSPVRIENLLSIWKSGNHRQMGGLQISWFEPVEHTGFGAPIALSVGITLAALAQAHSAEPVPILKMQFRVMSVDVTWDNKSAFFDIAHTAISESFDKLISDELRVRLSQ